MLNLDCKFFRTEGHPIFRLSWESKEIEMFKVFLSTAWTGTDPEQTMLKFKCHIWMCQNDSDPEFWFIVAKLSLKNILEQS